MLNEGEERRYIMIYELRIGCIVKIRERAKLGASSQNLARGAGHGIYGLQYYDVIAVLWEME
jgi:hypothetical protein